MTTSTEITSIDQTLRWIVLMFRLMGWLWCMALIVVAIDRFPHADRQILIAMGALVTSLTTFTVVAARRGDFLGSSWFVWADGVVVAFLIAGGWLAGASDFLSGGYPASWIFVVAYAYNLARTVLISMALTLYYAVMHVVLDVASLELRTVGSIQFVVYGLLAGWTFDTLREREAMRIAAEARLLLERQAAVRHEERANLARRLHDSVLQTLHVIRTEADDPVRVRHLARRQERELRRTIDEFRSPHEHSFAADLLRARDEVEELFLVEIEAVIRNDAELTPALVAIVSAAHEAMANAAKHSGSTSLHLYSEISNGRALVNVHDRGRGLVGDDTAELRLSLTAALEQRIKDFGGDVQVEGLRGQGLDVIVSVPHP